MRHFHDVHEMIEALAQEARQQGCEITQRNGRTIAVIKTDCECGAQSVSEVNLTDLAATIWENLS